MRWDWEKRRLKEQATIKGVPERRILNLSLPLLNQVLERLCDWLCWNTLHTRRSQTEHLAIVPKLCTRLLEDCDLRLGPHASFGAFGSETLS